MPIPIEDLGSEPGGQIPSQLPPMDEFLKKIKTGKNKRMEKIDRLTLEVGGKVVGEIPDVISGIFFLKTPQPSPFASIPFLQEILEKEKDRPLAIATAVLGRLPDVLEVAIEAQDQIEGLLEELADKVIKAEKEGGLDEEDIKRIKNLLR